MEQHNSTWNNMLKFFNNVDYKRLLGYAGEMLDGIKHYAVKGSKETTRLMLELYYTMMADSTSRFNKLIIAVALAYQFLPNDLISRDEYGALGFLDNGVALYIVYRKVKGSITPEISKKVDDTLNKWADSISNFTIMKPENEQI